MMEPTDNELHAGCVGNVNATWTFHGRSGHSARPWDADNAIHAAARGIASLAELEREEHVFDGLTFYEVASVTEIRGGIAQNVIPDRVDCHVNYRYAPGRTPRGGRGAAARAVPGRRADDRLAGARPARSRSANPRAQALIAAGDLTVAPKQAWTPVAEFGQAGLDAVNFGPGAPAQAHRRDESVEIAALERSYRVLEAFARMRLSPVLAGLRTYPFVRLAEAKRRLLDAGVDVIDFGPASRARTRRSSSARRWSRSLDPQSRYPRGRGAARAAGGDRRRGRGAGSACRWTRTPR